MKELSKYTNLDLVNSLEREENLNKNLSVQHHKIDTIKCEKFEEAFQSENGSENQVTEVHEEEMPYKCLLCKAGFSKIEEITTHMNSFHEKKSGKVYTQPSYSKFKNMALHFLPIFECSYWLPCGFKQHITLATHELLCDKN